MHHARGEVWWGPAPQKDTPSYRPWLILSTGGHPFADVECVAAAMTTQRHDECLEVPDDAWVEGGSNVRSRVSPWYVATFKYHSFDRQQGRLSDDIVGQTAEKLHGYISQTR